MALNVYAWVSKLNPVSPKLGQCLLGLYASFYAIFSNAMIEYKIFPLNCFTLCASGAYPKYLAWVLSQRNQLDSMTLLRKHSFITMLGPWRTAPPCVPSSQFSHEFICPLHYATLNLPSKSCPLGTVHCLQPQLLLGEGCFCVVALSICTVHMCCLKGLLLLWGPGIVL